MNWVAIARKVWRQYSGNLGRGMRFPAALLIVACVAASFVIAQRQARFETGEENGALVRARSHWFFKQRAFPNKSIPSHLRLKALEQMQEMQRTSLQFVVPSRNGPSTWTPIGPQPITNSFFGNVTGRVLSLAFDPCDSTNNTVYLGGANGGVWKTTNGGTSWTPIGDAAPSLAAASLAVDAASCMGTFAKKILVGTGEIDFGGDIVFPDSFYGAGVVTLATTDGASYTATADNTFTHPSPLEAFDGGPRIGAIAIDPANHSVVLAAVRGSGTTILSGIWRSTDGGQTFVHVVPVVGANHVPHSVGTDVAFDFNDPTGKTAYAALGNDAGDPVDCANAGIKCNGVWISTDAGATWSKMTKLDTLGTQANFGHVTLTVGKTNGTPNVGSLYVAIASAGNSSQQFLGLFKSTNAGTSFSQLAGAPAACNFQCFFDMIPKASPTNVNLVFLAGAAGAGDASSIFRSTDGGTTWSNVSTGTSGILHVDFHGAAFSGDGTSFFVGNDGGVWGVTGNSNITATPIPWLNLNNPSLQITEPYPGLSMDPTSDTISFFGSQDNGFAHYTGSTAWADATGNVDGNFGTCGDGNRTLIDPTNNQVVYATCVDFNSPSANLINKSVNGGTTFAEAQTGITITDPSEFIPPITLDPSNTQTLYWGNFQLYQSTNGGASWTPITGDLTGTQALGLTNGGLTSIAVASSNFNFVYVTTGASFNPLNGAIVPSKVWMSQNATAGASSTFTEVDSGLPPRFATSISVDPSNPMIAYVTFSGFASCTGCDGLGHVFRTTNGGATWTDISGPLGLPTSLPDIPVNDIVLDPSIPGSTIYVATDVGVFMTVTGGVSWSPLGSGLPVVEGLSLKLRPDTRLLRLATHGRGIWDFHLSGTPGPVLNKISPSSVPANQNATVTLTGDNFSSGNEVVNLNGAPLPPGSVTFNSATQLTVMIPAASIPSANIDNLSVSDISVGQNSQSLTFVVTGAAPADFSFGTPNPGSRTVSVGQMAQYTLPVNSVNGFSGSVSFSCSSITPATSDFTCTAGSFSPNPLSVPSNGSANTVLSITPTANARVPAAPGPRKPLGLWIFAVVMLVAGAVFLIPREGARRRLAFGLALGLAVALLVTMSACGGGSGGGGGGNNSHTFKITVQGTAGNLNHTTNVTLTIH
jgi:photosystem II stability/assembly factor-like uncharacterized protein